jgi:hypothetical protein
MRDAADEIDEIVADAMKHREQQAWRLTPLITNAFSSSAIHSR